MSARALDERAVASLRDCLAAGPEPFGWKVGFNVRAAQEALGLAHSVLAPLREATLITEGRVSIAGQGNPLAEPEIAIELRRDVDPGSDAGTALAAIESLGCAVELVDLDLPLDDLRPILAGGIFHRGVAFGVTRQDVALNTVDVTVSIDGERVAFAEASSVDLAATITLAADLLGAAGGLLRGGQRIIAGSLTPPVPVRPGTRLTCDFGALGEVALDIATVP